MDIHTEGNVMIEDDDYQSTDHEKYIERELYCNLRPLAFKSNYLFGERLSRSDALTIARKVASVFHIAPQVMDISVSQWRTERMRFYEQNRERYKDFRRAIIRLRDRTSDDIFIDAPADPTRKLISNERHPVWRLNLPERTTAISLRGVGEKQLKILNKCWDGETFSRLDVFLTWIEPHLEGVDVKRGEDSKFWDAGPIDDEVVQRELTIREEEVLSDLGADLDDYR